MFLKDIARSNLPDTISRNQGKAILAASTLVGGTKIALSYRNKNDKRTFRQRLTDTGKSILPTVLIGTTLRKAKPIIGKLGLKHGRKGFIGGLLALSGANLGGHIAAQQMRRRHAENTMKNRKEGQRLKLNNVNLFGLKYKDYSSNKVY